MFICSLTVSALLTDSQAAPKQRAHLPRRMPAHRLNVKGCVRTLVVFPWRHLWPNHMQMWWCWLIPWRKRHTKTMQLSCGGDSCFLVFNIFLSIHTSRSIVETHSKFETAHRGIFDRTMKFNTYILGDGKNRERHSLFPNAACFKPLELWPVMQSTPQEV